MTIQTINIGNVVNDGLGDNLRTAFEKVNANFTELLTTFDLTAANAQELGADVFKEKTGSILKFRNLDCLFSRNKSPARMLHLSENNSMNI